MNYHIQHFESIDSTNKEVLRQAENGAKEGLTIVAEQQTDGKGRLGRTWETIDHALAMSVLLRPQIDATKVPQLSLVSAVAAHEALSLFAPQTRIKWPNDLLIDGKKVCGILTEIQQGKHGLAVVVGLGINVAEPASGWVKDMRTPPTSLNAYSQHNIHKDDVLQAILESLNTWYSRFIQDGFSPIRKAWEMAHIANGQTVSVHDGNTYIQGIALGLAGNGALRLLVNGEEQRIIAGDVSLMESKT
ncbi:biotin--[acetyl-CoA-carboxylase] ligase [Ghiorsea bivora]|uniref:biotin--[acetyl-CoA-carboxylase] ligase n=1 Tax=Ghiorsea bivora TaxID=1485545 RepID=UPI00068FCDDC|nr:biotin--[acetyl-CoA-carboxylase] ligase [Ghiorsea bivora]